MTDASSRTPLTRQEVVAVLDSVPTFHLMNMGKKIFGSPDEAGELAIRWFVDVDEAMAALELVQAHNPDVPLQLGVTPLGTAFALVQGWEPNGSKLPLRLQASRATVAGVAEDLSAAWTAEEAATALPIFSCAELKSDRVIPFWVSKPDVKATWLATGRSEAEMPKELVVADLRSVVAKAMSADGASEADWRKLMLVASQKSAAGTFAWQHGEWTDSWRALLSAGRPTRRRSCRTSRSRGT